jgi:hypothetical protein
MVTGSFRGKAAVALNTHPLYGAEVKESVEL